MVLELTSNHTVLKKSVKPTQCKRNIFLVHLKIFFSGHLGPESSINFLLSTSQHPTGLFTSAYKGFSVSFKGFSFFLTVIA